MKVKNLWILAGGLLLLTGCDVFQSARNDFNRLTSSSPTSYNHPAPNNGARPTAARSPTTSTSATATPATASAKPGDKVETATAKEGVSALPPNIVGKNEGQLRSMLGPPTTVEEHAPGKTWRYRDGQCTYNVQLYPDVQTRQYGTLAYEVKSDDNSDEGNRACLAQLRTRAQSGG